MIKKTKRAAGAAEPVAAPKKFKVDRKSAKSETNTKTEKPLSGKGKSSKFKPGGKPEFSKATKRFAKKTFDPKHKGAPEKVDWVKFKQDKKELRIKRKQAGAEGMFDVIVEAKKVAEVLRRKNLKGGTEERHKLVAKLHGLLGGKKQYAKLVLSHDMARIVQNLLKFGPDNTRKEISQELIPIAKDMLTSVYGRNCFKKMLKYGSNDVRLAAINQLYGRAVKIASSATSAAVFEYAYSTWATLQQKQHFIQEFFGDLYKQAKDDKVKHLRDVYKDSPSMKTAALNATKANLTKILNKSLLDSGLAQSVLYQYLTECSVEEKAEMISQLAPHVVVVSNSKDGARVAMQCIWHGSNKDRKVAVKAIKEHAVELFKHEHGHCSIITLLDAADDTVLINKVLIAPIIADVENLAKDEWGRKVLLWLVAPADSTHFHPLFMKELEAGRESSTSKKEPDVRRKELLQYSSDGFLKSVAAKPEFWMSTASIAVVTLAILKSGSNADTTREALESISRRIIDPDWKIKEDEKETLGIEHAGLHMILKKLAQHDKAASAAQNPTFGQILLDVIVDGTIKSWVALNRGCFLLVAVYENGTEEIQESMKRKLSSHLGFIKKQNSPGAKILVKKLV